MKFKRYGFIAGICAFLSVICLMFSGIFSSAQYESEAFTPNFPKNATAFIAHDYKIPFRDFIVELLKENDVSSIWRVFTFSDTQAVLYNEPLIGFPLVSGRIMTPEETQSEKGFALVGKTVYENNKNNNVFFFNGSNYQIIGVLGYDNRESIYDESVFINLGAVLNDENILADGEYIVSLNKGNLKLGQNFSGEGYLEKVSLNRFSVNIASLINDDRFVGLLYLTAIMTLLSAFSFSLSWIEKRFSEIQIRKRLGASDAKILLMFYSRFLIIGVAVYICILPLYFVVHKPLMSVLNYAYAPFNVSLASLLYAACLICFGLGAFPCYISIRKIQPSQRSNPFD